MVAVQVSDQYCVDVGIFDSHSKQLFIDALTESDAALINFIEHQ